MPEIWRNRVPIWAGQIVDHVLEQGEIKPVSAEDVNNILKIGSRESEAVAEYVNEIISAVGEPDIER